MSPISKDVKQLLPDEDPFWQETEAVRARCVEKVSFILAARKRHGDSASTADDYVQEAIFRLGSRKVTYQSPQHLENIIVKTAFFIISDEDRAVRQQRTTNLTEGHVEVDRAMLRNFDPNVERKIETTELFASLTEPQQTLLKLFLEGYSLKEIAVKLEKHRATIFRQYDDIIGKIKMQIEIDRQKERKDE